MRQFVESLKRLYRQGLIDEVKIADIFKNEKITEEEKWYIIKTDDNQ